MYIFISFKGTVYVSYALYIYTVSILYLLSAHFLKRYLKISKYIYLFIAMGEALLHTICCLMPFFERDLVDMLPFLVSSMMTSVPESLHQNIIDCLCYNILPFTVGK